MVMLFYFNANDYLILNNYLQKKERKGGGKEEKEKYERKK